MNTINFRRKRIRSNHHRDAMIKITSILIDLAGQEGCDGSPYDEMIIAAEYIEELENRIIELESNFNAIKDV